MLKVLSPGIILTSSKEVIDRLFTGKPLKTTEAAKLISQIDYENTILINQSSSKNLVEFEFNFNFASKAEYGVTLTFLDVDNNFVQQYLDSNVNLILLKKIQETINSKKKINDFDISKIYSKEILDPKLTYHTIYVAFGNGDDIQKWGGPFRLNLKGFNITNFEGLNRITLEFGSLAGPIRTTQVHRGSERSLENSVASNWRFLKKDLIAGLQVQSEVTLKDLSNDSPNRSNFDSIFFNLLKKYIAGVSQIPEDNIVLLLPSLHSIYEETYRQYISEKINAPGPEGYNFVTANFRPDIVVDFAQSFAATLGFDIIPKSRMLPPEQFRENESSYGYIIQFGKITDKLELMDFYEPLDSFFEKLSSIISKHNVNYPQSSINYLLGGFSLLEEVDYAFINILSKLKIIKDSTKNVLFVGDSDLISKLVYCNDVFSLTQALDSTPQLGFTLYDENLLKLFDKEYRYQFFQKYIKLSNSSDFQEASNASDEFDYSKISKSLVEMQGLPIFKHNLPNSNILSLNIDYNNKLLDFLSYNVVQKERHTSIRSISTILSERIRSIIPLDQLLSGYEPTELSDIPFKDLVTIISIKLEEFFSSGENIKDYTKKFLKEDHPVKFHGFTITELATVFAIDYYFKADKDVPKIYVDSSITNNKLELFEQINRRAISVNIKTLPFFNISKTTLMGKKCLLLFNRNTTLGQSANQSYIKFSGVYKIVGYSHTITSTESYSTFTLIIDNEFVNVTDPSNRQTIEDIVNLNYSKNPINILNTEKIDDTGAILKATNSAMQDIVNFIGPYL